MKRTHSMMSLLVAGALACAAPLALAQSSTDAQDNGLPAFYSPDFMVRTADAIYLAETKAQDQTSHPNVLRKRKAAAAWCERVNALPPELRSGLPWHYALVGESVFRDWRQKGARLAELLAFSRVRAGLSSQVQSRLSLDE